MKPMTESSFLPPILAYLPRLVGPEEKCPCGSRRPYQYCCLPIAVPGGEYAAQAMAMIRLFHERHYSFYLYHPQPTDYARLTESSGERRSS